MSAWDLHTTGDLALALDEYAVGDSVQLTVQRGIGDSQVRPLARQPLRMHELSLRMWVLGWQTHALRFCVRAGHAGAADTAEAGS